MKAYFVRIWDKDIPEPVGEGSVDAPYSKKAAELLEGGPVEVFSIPFEGEPLFYVGKEYV